MKTAIIIVLILAIVAGVLMIIDSVKLHKRLRKESLDETSAIESIINQK